jgi:carbamate kinase
VSRAAIAVLAFGGGVMSAPEQGATYRQQVRLARRAARAVVTLLREGFRVVVLHGNAPHVSRELVRNEESSTKLPPYPLDLCVASAQGQSSYLLDVELRNELRRLQIEKPVSTILKYTLVGLDDPAFRQPVVPVGPALSEWRAKTLNRTTDVRLVEGPNRGWRRVVASPRPLQVVNTPSIEAMLKAGHVVIAGGGGGIPVAVDARGQLIGVEALVDKDRTAALLGVDLGAELLVLLTSVDHVYAHFGKVDQRPIERISARELRALAADGHFPAASIGPKVEAALEFVEDGGNHALITSPEQFAAALADRVGTRVSGLAEPRAASTQLGLFDTTAGVEVDA